MNGIFPDYVGASNVDVYQSLYPDWMNPLDVVIAPPANNKGGGGVDHEYEQLVKRLHQEDELIMVMLSAFLEMDS